MFHNYFALFKCVFVCAGLMQLWQLTFKFLCGVINRDAQYYLHALVSSDVRISADIYNFYIGCTYRQKNHK